MIKYKPYIKAYRKGELTSMETFTQLSEALDKIGEWAREYWVMKAWIVIIDGNRKPITVKVKPKFEPYGYGYGQLKRREEENDSKGIES